MRSRSWEQLAKYRLADRTLTVPWACRSEWHSAFELPLYLWEEGFTEDSRNLHYIMIQSICAPIPVKVQYGQDAEEGQTGEHQGSVTRAAKARLRRWCAGDGKALWDEAQADRDN